jgi:hypothetical protein
LTLPWDPYSAYNAEIKVITENYEGLYEISSGQVNPGNNEDPVIFVKNKRPYEFTFAPRVVIAEDDAWYAGYLEIYFDY